jgi:hypothetical protein
VFEQPDRWRALGVRRYPALAHGDEVMNALFLTKRKIRKFLEAAATKG